MTHIPTLTLMQSAVYLACLELGTDTILNIAKKADVPRSTTYLVIEELKAKGLMAKTKAGKKTLFTPVGPDKLLSLLAQQEASLAQSREQLTNLLPRLKAVENVREDKPLVSFYEGFEGIKTILDKSLVASEILVLCSGYQQTMESRVAQYLNEVYLPETNRLGIITREIVTEDPDLESYRERYQSKDHIIKVSPRQPAAEHLDKLIFGDVVALVAYDVLNGTVIEHPHIAKFERALFEENWRSIN